MKKIDIINAVNVLCKVRINKIGDDRVKTALILDYRKLRAATKELDEDRRTIIEKFENDFADELQEIRHLRLAGKPVEGHESFLAAESDCNRILSRISHEPVQINGLITVSLDDFLQYVKEEDISLEEIDQLTGVVLSD